MRAIPATCAPVNAGKLFEASVGERFPDWERKHLRTTSRLEHFNRTVRRRTRSANAYHSHAGLTAMMSQETQPFHDAQPAPLISIERDTLPWHLYAGAVRNSTRADLPTGCGFSSGKRTRCLVE